MGVKDIRVKCSTTGCCPFAFSEESDEAQNYGCLPSSSEIVHMKKVHNKTWACHANYEKPCMGLIKYLKKNKLDCKVEGTLITDLDDWSQYTSDMTQEQSSEIYKGFGNDF